MLYLVPLYLRCSPLLILMFWFPCSDQSFWIDGPAPLAGGWPSLRILSKQRISNTNLIISLEVSGPDHMSIFIQPINDTKLIDWSLDRTPLRNNFTAPYFIYLSYALDPAPFRFHMEFQVSYHFRFAQEKQLQVSYHFSSAQEKQLVGSSRWSLRKYKYQKKKNKKKTPFTFKHLLQSFFQE